MKTIQTKNIEFPLKRRVLIERVPIINEIIVFDTNEEVRHYANNYIDEFINGKSKEEIQSELREIFFTKEWCGKFPAPLGTMYYHRLLMQMYIPHDFRKVCEEYKYKYWDEINEIQKGLLEKWADECNA
jgi:hypothetical protein